MPPPNVTDSLLDEARALSAAFDKLSHVISDGIGVGPSELTALELIGRGQPVTAGDLARELNLTTGSITSLVDRLEKAGFAKRAPDPSDRRRVLVVPTRKQQQLQTLFEPLDAGLRAILKTYSDAELAQLVDFVRQVREVVSGVTEGVRDRSNRIVRRPSSGRGPRR